MKRPPPPNSAAESSSSRSLARSHHEEPDASKTSPSINRKRSRNLAGTSANNTMSSPDNQGLGSDDTSSTMIGSETSSRSQNPEKNKAKVEDDVKLQPFKQFDTVQDCSDHHYSNYKSVSQKEWAKAIQHEWKILEKDLPETIYVRVYEDRMDLMRAAIVGAARTPYHDGLFFFDIYFPSNYPNEPPKVYYHSGGLLLNPNLYRNGKVCLSLLNTWAGSKEEMWIPSFSTMLQVLLSIQALILNADPYFNEPGYEMYKDTNPMAEKVSTNCNEKVFLLSCRTMLYSLQRPPRHFEDLVAIHFRQHGRTILVACKAYMNGAPIGCDVGNVVKDVPDATVDNKKSSSMPLLKKLFQELLTEFAAKGADCEDFLAQRAEDEDASASVTNPESTADAYGKNISDFSSIFEPLLLHSDSNPFADDPFISLPFTGFSFNKFSFNGWSNSPEVPAQPLIIQQHSAHFPHHQTSGKLLQEQQPLSQHSADPLPDKLSSLMQQKLESLSHKTADPKSHSLANLMMQQQQQHQHQLSMMKQQHQQIMSQYTAFPHQAVPTLMQQALSHHSAHSPHQESFFYQHPPQHLPQHPTHLAYPQTTIFQPQSQPQYATPLPYPPTNTIISVHQNHPVYQPYQPTIHTPILQQQQLPPPVLQIFNHPAYPSPHPAMFQHQQFLSQATTPLSDHPAFNLHEQQQPASQPIAEFPSHPSTSKPLNSDTHKEVPGPK